MELSEGKLFTIEALNRIEGFAWPEFANYASMCNESSYIMFWGNEPINNGRMFIGSGLVTSLDSKVDHYKWSESLITREEFESVDGWVRNNFIFTKINSLIDVTIKSKGDDYVIDGSCDNWTPEWESGDIVKWRYHKPQKQEVKPEPESIETMIRRYKDAGENKRAAIDKLNKSQADVEQAEALEDSLLMAIEAWAESHGFDIRVLSESEEKPELVITDISDLQIGDIIKAVGTTSINGWLGGWAKSSIGNEFSVMKVTGGRIYVDSRNRMEPILITESGVEFEFIRRPEKK